MKQGELICVGVGMMLGAHISPRARQSIEEAEVVFVAVSDRYVEQWVESMNPNCISLQPLYQTGKSRLITYQEMVEAMLGEVRAGRRVVGAFYGHPGVFAKAPHEAIRQARAEGHRAHMEAGISAEDVMIADLGFDPGACGLISYEATQFMIYDKPVDPTAHLILWQVGIVGERSLTRFESDLEARREFTQLLLRDYPADHPIWLYEAPTLAIMTPRMDHMALSEFPQAELTLNTTLLIPPTGPMQRRESAPDDPARLTCNDAVM